MKLVNVTKKYGEQAVFENLSLEIAQGEIVCVLGESGGGKTTLLNILSSLTPFEGSVEGVPTEISYIFQEDRLLPHLTARENILFIGADEKRADELLQKTELTACTKKMPRALSGGERQRVSFARAFSKDFRLLLMDEPFSSLDTGLKIRLIGVFATLWAEKKNEASAVFVTHDIEEALMVADRILLLKKGNVVLDERVERKRFPSAYGEENPLRAKLLNALI